MCYERKWSLTGWGDYARFSLGLLGLVGSACGGDAAVVDAARADSSGIEILTSPPTDRFIRVDLERAWQVGGTSDVELQLTSIGPWSVASDSTHRLYLLDSVAGQVHVVDSGGQLIETWGKLGPGPGELQSPVLLGSRERGGVGVVDFGKGRVVGWSPAGIRLPERRLATPIVLFPVHFADELDLLTVRGRNSAGEAEDRLVLADGVSTEIVARTASIPRHQASFPTCDMDVLVSPLFAPKLLWDYHRGLLAVVSDATYEIEIFAEGKLTRVIRRDIAPFEATEELALKSVAGGVDSNGCTIPAHEEVAGRGFSETIPVINALVMRKNGEVWAERGLPGEQVIDVISIKHGYRGTLPPGTPMPTLFLSPGLFITVETDDLGVPQIIAYNLSLSTDTH